MDVHGPWSQKVQIPASTFPSNPSSQVTVQVRVGGQNMAQDPRPVFAKLYWNKATLIQLCSVCGCFEPQ